MIWDYVRKAYKVPESNWTKITDEQYLALLQTSSPSCCLDLVDDGHDLVLEQVGTIFGITRERVRQVQDRALRKIRNRALNLGIGEDLLEWIDRKLERELRGR